MKLILLLISLLASAGINAQIFPVQVNPRLVPPYSPYLSDYTASGAQKLMVQIRANDITIADYPCKLRITIEGVGITIRTKPNFVPQPLMLQGGGIPQVLYGEDLAEYFHPDALDFSGLTRTEYTQRARLPEGLYQFTVEVLDYHRSTVVSNSGMAVAWIILNDPPFLNMPSNFAKLQIQNPTSILFSWTPRHAGSPNAAFTTEYTFRLIEIRPDSRNPYDAFLTQLPLFETTTTQNQILYGTNEPALIPGRKYAWQVEARDLEGRDLFRNKGRSEVFIFQFGEALPVPENFQLRWAKPTTLSMRWDPVLLDGEEVKYRLLYRPRRRQEDHQWYETRTKFTQKTLYHLQPNTEYEMKVRTESPVRESPYTDIRIFRTLRPAEDAFICKDLVAPPPPPAHTVPAFPLSVNDTLHAGGYEVLVRDVVEVEGRYYGSGVAIVPWFNAAKVRVTFENIRVNDRFWLTSGTVKSVWNDGSAWLLQEETPILPGKAPQTGELNITVVAADSLITIKSAAIASVSRDENGNIVVTTTDGKEQTLAHGDSYAIVDEAGNGYVVDKQGNVAKTTAIEAHAAAGRGDRTYDLAIQFAPGDGTYGFDEKKHDALSLYYQQLDEGSYVAWKALSSARADEVEGRLLSGDLNIADISFRAGVTPLTPASSGTGKVKLRLQGKMAGMEEELVALYNTADTLPEKVVGKLNLVTYDPIHYKLEIVPVNGAALPAGLGVETISERVNKIFGQAVVEWRVSLAEGIHVALPKTFDEGESGLLSNYTGDMKKVLNAWGRLQANTYYLFLIEEPRNPATLGYMPRNRQAGFVFVGPHNDDAAELLKTIGHELGHGAFNLKHIFSEHNLAVGTTDNIMDYSDGTALYKYQWDYIHEPRSVIDLFETGEDAASVVVTNMGQLKNFANEDGSFTFLAPTGVPFTLPAATQSVKFWTNDLYVDDIITLDESPDGALIAFTIGNETYRYHKLEGSTSGSGYKINTGDHPYVDQLSKKQTGIEHAIIGLPCAEGGELKLIARRVRFESNLSDENYSAEGTVATKLPVEDPYSIDYAPEQIYLDAQLDFAYTDEARTFINDNQACLNEMVHYVIKAANVIQRNPGYYTLYKACGGYEMKFPEEGKTPAERAAYLGFYYEKLRGFANELLKYIRQSAYTDENLLTIHNADSLSRLLRNRCEADFKHFTFDQRKHIVTVLSNGKLHDYWLGFGNNRENIVIYALKQTPDDQHEAMLELLKSDRYALLKTLIIKCNNQLIGQDNFDKLIDGVTVMIQKTYAYERFHADIQENKILRWGGNGYFQKFLYECPEWAKVSGAKTIAFTYNSYSPYFTPDGQFPSTEALNHRPEYHTLEVAPFDYVVVRVYRDVELENGLPLLKRSVGEFQAVPALYLYWMIQRKATDETLARIKSNVNLLLFLIGGAEIAAARSGLRLALAITDQTLFATSFVLETGPRRLLEEGPHGEEWKSVFKAFDTFNLLYGAARIGQSLSLAASDVLSKRALLSQLKEAEDWNSFSPLQRGIVEKEIAKMQEGLDELEGMLQRNSRVDVDDLTSIITGQPVADFLALPAPVGKFRQLVAENRHTYRAADFWKQTSPDFKYFKSGDGRYLIKHDPTTGRMLFVDGDNKQFIGFALDEKNLIGDDYEKLLKNLKTIHGLPGGVNQLTIRGHTIHLAPDKPNFFLGKYDPNSVPGITGEIGTDDIINELGILKNYSFADEALELRPGSVHVLNMPDKMPLKPGQDFFDAYNKSFLDLIVKQKNRINLVFVSDPRKRNLLKRFYDGDVATREPSGLAREVRYLRDREIKVIKFIDGSTINLEDIPLNNLKWKGWKY